jgi:hypothetical protein
MKFLVLILLIALLTMGCKVQDDGTLVLTTAEIPEALLECVPVPERDKPFIQITPRQAALLLTRYKTAHKDCYEKLASVRELYYASKSGINSVNESNTYVSKGLSKWNDFISSLSTGS